MIDSDQCGVAFLIGAFILCGASVELIVFIKMQVSYLIDSQYTVSLLAVGAI
ncbi:hypothetical protein BMETH_578_0 [methanotrophic bacterial endosymbiont of Bathymodiolus sp.]|nr:hypothetical protein BMETH_578_0 [methanotrophic bacterial endosymbiont of Bathymodiolus sp.]